MSSTIYWDKLRILVTNSCNYQCPFCHNEGQSSDKSIKTMDFDKFKIIIDALKDEDIHEICFSGGEPFLEKKLVEMTISATDYYSLKKYFEKYNVTIDNQYKEF